MLLLLAPRLVESKLLLEIPAENCVSSVETPPVVVHPPPCRRLVVPALIQVIPLSVVFSRAPVFQVGVEEPEVCVPLVMSWNSTKDPSVKVPEPVALPVVHPVEAVTVVPAAFTVATVKALPLNVDNPVTEKFIFACSVDTPGLRVYVAKPLVQVAAVIGEDWLLVRYCVT